MILEKREFIAKLEAVDSDDVAIEQLLSFLYLNKKPRIENFQTFRCQPPVLGHLFQQWGRMLTFYAVTSK